MPVPSILQSRFVLVGPGRAGMALARSWVRAGGAISQVVGQTSESAASAGRELGASGRTAEDAPPDCDLLVLAVPDDRIAQVAGELARRTTPRFAFHLSGALGSSLLAPFSRRGAATASLHPLRAFTGDPGDDWRGALVAIEGEPEAVEAAERLAEALGAIGYRIRSESKPLYHAAAALAAGGTMALLSVAVRAAVDAGLPEEQARPALARLASEAAAATAGRPFAGAFTGPVARRDVETVREHLRAASGRPDFLGLYERLAKEILAETSGRGQEEQILAILEEMAHRGPTEDPRRGK
ncbi:MAG: Rossmann-like and DUF2520 domain-containing protein [Thermoanaerobaculia bacterium]